MAAIINKFARFFLAALYPFVFLTCRTPPPTTQKAAISGDIWLERATRDIAQARWISAKHALEKAKQTGQPAPQLQAKVALILGEYDTAKAMLHTLLDQKPATLEKADILANLGLIAKLNYRDQEALRLFNQALALQPNVENGWFHIGDLLRRGGEMEQAAVAYHKAFQTNPEDVNALLGKVWCRLWLKQSHSAYQILLAKSSDFRTHPLVVATMVRMLAHQGQQNPKKAQLAVRLAKQLDPKEETGFNSATIAMAYAANNQFQQAVTAQKQAIKLATKRGPSPQLTLFHEHLSEFESGRKLAQTFDKRFPGFSQDSLAPEKETPLGPLHPWQRPNMPMSKRIAAFTSSSNMQKNAYLNGFQAETLARQLASGVPQEEQLGKTLQWALEMLRHGDTQEALELFEGIDAQLNIETQTQQAIKMQTIDYIKAIAYLRQAEAENCLEHHTSESCLFPIQKGGIHQRDAGAKGAIETLMGILAVQNDNLSARWLLNLAYMLIGGYPQNVPPEYLMPLPKMSAPSSIGAFSEIAQNLKLDSNDLAGGSIIEDFDNDGFLDIMVSSWGPLDPLTIFKNTGTGTFEDVSANAGLKGIFGGLNLVQTDFDNDGLKDVLVLRGAWLGDGGHQPNSLLRNLGHFKFEDVTEKAGLLSFRPTQAAAWFDFDNDGFLDLFIGNETQPETNHPSELFHNQGDGTFIEIAAELALAQPGFVKGVSAGDFDNDGWMDLYVSRFQQTNLLFKNIANAEHPTGRTFVEMGPQAGVEHPIQSFPTWFWDFNNDGLLDLFVADYNNTEVGMVASDLVGWEHNGEPSKLYKNLGNGTFEDISESAGLNRLLVAMGSNFGDVDADGFLDMYVGTGSPDLGMLIPNRMFQNLGNDRFADVTSALNVGHLQKGHGVSFADVDHDGDLDLFTVMGGAYSGDVYRNAFFENPGNSNKWLCLVLEGTRANRPAIGARITLSLRGPQGERSIHRQVTSGGSFGASPFRQFIGLGDAEAITNASIRWPGEETAVSFGILSMNTAYRLTQDSREAVVFELKPIAFKQTATSHHH